ncbi:hypothetical protein MHBO_003238 [Bonamia ostreae]|uniref:Amino acid transporter n=1 Tax=Bonamia ostreae TaxID=126728 RepID=A0ABV2APW5_9EUKA
MGVSDTLSNALVPLAFMLQINGTTAYNVMVISFTAHIYKQRFPVSSKILLVLVSTFFSVTTPPIPAGSVLNLPFYGKMVGIDVPAEIISLMMMTDFFFDRLSTVFQIFILRYLTCFRTQ